eukprot:TRINITY_DN10285_c0_g1_i2.p1 TRINITY_DN10285_c0_g1~~TRINITY_DN10285_c0_g1_i2.p1  ORF type:complete len:521 (-),score=85.32 TRINITY_DN10285_c0_g1_i2:244-1806(-)
MAFKTLAAALHSVRPHHHLRRAFSSSPLQWNIEETHKRLQDGSTSSEEITTACFEEMARKKSLNAFIKETAEFAAQQAIQSDNRRKKGESRGVLDGVPVAVKDNFCTEGIQTTAASKTLDGFVPPYNATVVKKLYAAGAVLVGKTNMDEFAMGNTNTNSFFGATRNPWSEVVGTEVTAGGSSGGSAVAVAARCCYGALGSDTGGSIRLPSAYCGVVGLKPTYGRVSRYGLIAYASSLDTPAISTRSVTDAAHMLRAIEGEDKFDSTSVIAPPTEVPSLSTDQPLRGLVVGIPVEYYVKELSNETVALWDQGARWLQEAGAQVVYVSLPTTKKALATYYILAPAEASSNLARYDGLRYGYCLNSNYSSLSKMYTDNRSAGFGPEVQRRILVGAFTLSNIAAAAYFQKAQQVRTLIWEDFVRVFNDGVHLLLTPTAPSAAPALHDIAHRTPVEGYLDDIMTVPPNLAGLPSISVPSGKSKGNVLGRGNGLPLGLQLVGRPFQESVLLKAALALEQSAKFQQI